MAYIIDSNPPNFHTVSKVLKLLKYDDICKLAYAIETARSGNNTKSRRKVGPGVLWEALNALQ